MVKQDILGGLFSAVSRGIDLKNAMQSLYNAGYEKEEIEEAAIIIQKGQFTQDPITQKIIPIVEKLVEEKKEEPKKEPIQEIIQIVLNLGIEKEKIFSADINHEAVIHCQKLGFNCIESNLFEKINDKYDIIIFNPPYLPEDKKNVF